MNANQSWKTKIRYNSKDASLANISLPQPLHFHYDSTVHIDEKGNHMITLCQLNNPSKYQWINSINQYKSTLKPKQIRFMMTSSNGNVFRVTGHLCGEFTDPGEIPAQGPVTRSFDVFFDLRLNKWFRKQSWCWWFETTSRPLWRHCNVTIVRMHIFMVHSRGTKVDLMSILLTREILLQLSTSLEAAYRAELSRGCFFIINPSPVLDVQLKLSTALCQSLHNN